MGQGFSVAGDCVSRVLSCLSNVRKRSPDRWSARCPAHDDHSPSLSIGETPDGRVLLFCHAGCDAQAILSAVGLGFSDLFPNATEFQGPLKRRRMLSASQALELLDNESLLVSIVAYDIGVRKKFNPVDCDRVAVAYGRIAAFRREVYQ
jgi:hypothetical protein